MYNEESISVFINSSITMFIINYAILMRFKRIEKTLDGSLAHQKNVC